MMFASDEFPVLSGKCYLDNAGSAVSPATLVKHHSEHLIRNLASNPHSLLDNNQSDDYVEKARARVLAHFSANGSEYCVVFTSGASAALKLVGEYFDYGAGGQLCYLKDNHTSAVGIREYALNRNVNVTCVDESAFCSEDHHASDNDHGEMTPNEADTSGSSLFVYPLQSNFSGFRYPVADWVHQVKSGCLGQSQWFVLADAASLVSTSPLVLAGSGLDFVTISFYKMFGYPTGLGALLVRRCSLHKLKKTYFGGGSIEGAGIDRWFHFPKTDLPEAWFEDGTLAFQQISALQYAFNAIDSIGGMTAVATHTFDLAKLAHDTLQCLRHKNGRHVIELYCPSEFRDPRLQGPILNFNIRRPDGAYVGYSEVFRLASLYSIILRVGCCCNIGACQRFLQITTEQLKQNHEAGHRCGDAVDLINGQPTGSIRISFGYHNNQSDVQKLVDFIRDLFVDVDSKPESASSGCDLATGSTQTAAIMVSGINVFPVKSCSPFKVSKWPISDSGFLYDRMWSVVDSRGKCLTLNRQPDLRKIEPIIDMDNRLLVLTAQGFEALSLPLDNHQPSEEDNSDGTKRKPSTSAMVNMEMCNVNVCGTQMSVADCGDAAAAWISDVLTISGCRLVRRPVGDIGGRQLQTESQHKLKSMANDSQYLIISQTSVRNLCTYIQDHMNSEVDEADMADRFRANIIVDGAQTGEENDWAEIHICNTRLQFKCIAECQRCSMICIDKETGAKLKEPLRSLTRLKGPKPTFGIHLTGTSANVSHQTMNDVISVGDTIKVVYKSESL